MIADGCDSARAKMTLLTPPRAAARLRFGTDQPPIYLVTVDTEEDFDWNAPFSRTGYRLDSVKALDAAQHFFRSRQVRPIYLADWPVVHDPAARERLLAAAEGGGAEIGAQLHPWVTPPHTEEVSRSNSFAGNLPPELEAAKLAALTHAITKYFGHSPRIYRAGRYGVGPATHAALRQLGYDFDTSVRSGFDYRAAGGPDFRAMPPWPWRVGGGVGGDDGGDDGELIELPLSTIFTGGMGRLGRRLYHPLARASPWLLGPLARTRLLERTALTPEGVPAARACAAIDAAAALGLPVLTLSFHSPSLSPGNTPYVRSNLDLRNFYLWWDVVLAHLARRGFAAGTLDDVVARAAHAASRSAATRLPSAAPVR